MFNGSRFFNLLRKWKEEDKPNYISILRYVMNHHFDSLAGTTNSSKLIIRNAKQRFFITEIAHVLSILGYYHYTIEFRESGTAIVTLRNSL